MYVKNSTPSGFSVKTYRGDAKTMLAFDIPEKQTANLAGFTISCKPEGNPEYYLFNYLQFADPAIHAQIKGEPSNSSVNAPFQKFYWVHVPGNYHQGENVFYGPYTYTVTPRYFNDKGILQPIDTALSVSVKIQLAPFSNGAVELGFTRGFVQSQAFVHHFGYKAPFKPAGKDLQFDTKAIAGTNKVGNSFSFLDEYVWSGFTARDRIFSVLNEVANDTSLKLDVFAYDLNEPDVVAILLKLCQEGRIRIILDNASLHHDSTGTLAEDQFEKLFAEQSKGTAALKRGKFGRFSHDKIFIVYKDTTAQKVLLGSTNFSVTGMYVNSNHVVIIKDNTVAQTYASVFQESWNDGVKMTFSHSTWASKVYSFRSEGVPETEITFSPHEPIFALSNLKAIADRITAEKSSVLFAVMAIVPGTGPILQALEEIHTKQDIFSYGISDSPGNGIALYKPGNPTGVLVSGKPGQTKLPPPFDKEEPIPGLGHQIHHKFVICDFNGSNPVTYCGSSNLAQGGEAANGDNLLAIYDQDISTAFAIEAFSMVDHFNFRDKFGVSNNPAIEGKTVGKKTSKPVHDSTPETDPVSGRKPMSLQQNDTWTKNYYVENDAHCKERGLLA
jgi:hypothetical protein